MMTEAEPIIKKPYSGRLIFDHLPKTAGQAINAWLVSELGSRCVTPNLNGEHSSLIYKYGGAYSVISAHILFDEKEKLDPRYQYITLLRDPVDRAISWLYFVINNHDDTQLPFLRRSAINFFDGDRSIEENVSNIYVEHFCRIGGGGGSDEEKINNAFSAIKKYDVVGIYDEISDFLCETANLIGILPPNGLGDVNVTKQRPRVDEISPAMRERIVDLNRLDIRFFEMVVAWKKSRYQERGARRTVADAVQFARYDRCYHRNISTADLQVSLAKIRFDERVESGQLVTFDIDISLYREMRNFEVGIHILDSIGNRVFETNSKLLGYNYPLISSGYYRISHHVVVGIPAGSYAAGLSFSEMLPEGRRCIFWRDILYEFNVVRSRENYFIDHSYLPVAVNLTKIGGMATPVIVLNHAGCLRIAQSLEKITVGEVLKIGVEVFNGTDCLWQGDDFFPINFSYHWCDENGDSVIFDGLRTPIPIDGFRPGIPRTSEINVQAPGVPGTYQLVLTLVQESVRWFEENGFEAARHIVEIGDFNG